MIKLNKFIFLMILTFAANLEAGPKRNGAERPLEEYKYTLNERYGWYYQLQEGTRNLNQYLKGSHDSWYIADIRTKICLFGTFGAVIINCNKLEKRKEWNQILSPNSNKTNFKIPKIKIKNRWMLQVFNLENRSGDIFIAYLADLETELCFLQANLGIVVGHNLINGLSRPPETHTMPIDCKKLIQRPEWKEKIPWLDN